MFERFKHEASYYSATASLNALGLTDPWNKIGKNLFLSKIPLRGEKERIIRYISDECKQGPLGLVVSVVQDYELNETGYFMDPIRPSEWKQTESNDEFASEEKDASKEESHQIEQYRLDMKDFNTEVNINEAVNLIFRIQEEYRNKNKSVLIHCKAGKSRSAMLASCVLALYDLCEDENNRNKTSEELVEMAVEQILASRRQIKVSSALKQTAVKVIEEAKRIQSERLYNSIESKPLEKKQELTLKERADQCFANIEIKEEIRSMEIFQKMISYKNSLIKDASLKYPKRAEHIERLLTSIIEAKDGQWYAELVELSGPSKDLVKASPFFNVSDAEEDKQTREKLIEKLKNDVESLICLNLGCKKAEFREIYAREEEPQPIMYSS